MKEQVFKFRHMPAVYHGGGQYTLTADEGYVLQSGDEQVHEVKTTGYPQWKAVAAPATAPKAKKKAGKPTAKK